jgi:hypothetical protein
MGESIWQMEGDYITRRRLWVIFFIILQIPSKIYSHLPRHYYIINFSPKE